jgi:hypothetical protein
MQHRHTINWDIWTSLAFTFLGLAIIGDAWTFPRGARGVPGPAFFPMAIGALLILLSVAIGAGALRRPAAAAAYWDRTGREPIFGRMTAVMALLIVYVSLWTAVPFLVRTPLLLVALYRLFRESWIRALLLAVAITAGLYAIFEGALSIQL